MSLVPRYSISLSRAFLVRLKPRQGQNRLVPQILCFLVWVEYPPTPPMRWVPVPLGNLTLGLHRSNPTLQTCDAPGSSRDNNISFSHSTRRETPSAPTHLQSLHQHFAHLPKPGRQDTCQDSLPSLPRKQHSKTVYFLGLFSSLLQQTFEHLRCARHYFRSWGHKRVQDRVPALTKP